MAYKYQLETIEELKKAINKIEDLTEEHHRIEIATVIDNNSFEQNNETIFAEINGLSYFTKQSDLDYMMCKDIYRKCEPQYYSRIHFKKNIFLELNNLIDKIIKDNKKRENFHKILNYELKALNETLNK